MNIKSTCIYSDGLLPNKNLLVSVNTFYSFKNENEQYIL